MMRKDASLVAQQNSPLTIGKSSRTILIVMLQISFAMLAGCTDNPASPLSTVGLRAPSQAKQVTLPTVSLSVQVSNANASGFAYNIRNDGKGAYVDGTQNVQAVLDQYGTFAFNTRNTRQAAQRWVTYDFSNPVDPANTYRPSPTNDQNYHFSTGASAYSPFIPIQNLGVGGNPSIECIYMGNAIANSSTQWRVSFHKGLEDTSTSPAAYAVVTRQSISPAVWTVAPVGSCSPNTSIAALRSGDSSVLYGYYNIPFFFTLTAR